MITPTWNNAPRLSDLLPEQRAYEAKKAHNASMFPNYAGHSGIEKSREDRKTLTKREFPLFLKRKRGQGVRAGEEDLLLIKNKEFI